MSSIFVFSLNENTLKIMKNAFYFTEKAILNFEITHLFVLFPSLFFLMSAIAEFIGENY